MFPSTNFISFHKLRRQPTVGYLLTFELSENTFHRSRTTGAGHFYLEFVCLLQATIICVLVSYTSSVSETKIINNDDGLRLIAIFAVLV